MFKVMDTGNDGIVSYEELKSGIAKFGSHLAESEVQMLIEAVSNLKHFACLLECSIRLNELLSLDFGHSSY